jgi:hypothetical protein
MNGWIIDAHAGVACNSGLLLPDNLDTFDTIYVVFEYVQTDLERLLRSDQVTRLLPLLSII